MWIGYLASADRSFFIFEKAHISGTFHHLFELLTVVYFGGIIGAKFADLSRRPIPHFES
jgi:hypothetical protein